MQLKTKSKPFSNMIVLLKKSFSEKERINENSEILKYTIPCTNIE